MNRALYAPVLAVVVTAPSGAEQPAIARLYGRNVTPAQIDSTLNRLIQAAHVTGAGVALFHDGKVVYLKTYGLRDAEKDLPLTPDSVMTAASLTKSAFATVVMRLVHRGVLNLDKSIERYLGKPLGDFAPYTDLKGDPRTAKITLRILLDHTTGFANFRGLEDDHKLHIHYDPGTHYGYSGEGINLAQFVVEKVTGKSATADAGRALRPAQDVAHQHDLAAALRIRLRQRLRRIRPFARPRAPHQPHQRRQRYSRVPVPRSKQ